VKVQGQRAYEIARKGEEAEIKAKEIEIYSLEFTKLEMPFLEFKVTCSKGTYIRSLARDFGRAIKSGAFLYELRRTKIGDYSVEEALQLESLKFARIKTQE
jgi:tRNA pseudouridine55 synthase